MVVYLFFALTVSVRCHQVSFFFLRFVGLLILNWRYGTEFPRLILRSVVFGWHNTPLVPNLRGWNSVLQLCVCILSWTAPCPRIFVGNRTERRSRIMCALKNKLPLNLRPTEVRLYHRIKIPVYATEHQWWQSNVPKNKMSLIFNNDARSLLTLTFKNYWWASKWSPISFSHWQCPSDGDFSFPRFVSLLMLSLWAVRYNAT
jgi:hypothetical protein